MIAELKALLKKEQVDNPDIGYWLNCGWRETKESTNSLALAIQYLDQVEHDYQSGNVDEARRKAVLAYLDGVEPVEPSLRAHAPCFNYHA